MANRPWWGEFLCGGSAATLAICCTNPVDVVKTRMVLQGIEKKPAVYTGVGSALVHIGRQEGLRGLQQGLAPACIWQFSNVSIRFGVYEVFKTMTGIGNTEKTVSPFQQWLKSMGLAACSGALGSVVSNPFFILKTRYQAAVGHEGPAPGLWRSLNEMRQADGVAGWMRGLSAFMPRVIVASSVQLSTYDLIKSQLVRKGFDKTATSTHTVASMITAVAVVFAMQPFDFACTRLVNTLTTAEKGGAEKAASLAVEYTGPMDVIRKTVASEGVLGIYSGVSANYWRFGPYCVFTFIFLERLRELETLILKRIR